MMPAQKSELAPDFQPQFQSQGFDSIRSCVHCGLCLDKCPTYKLLRIDTDSPRGRLFLMRAMWEKRVPVTAEAFAPLDRCLGCLACETACPSHVPFGDLLEKSRIIKRELIRPNRFIRHFRQFFLQRVFTSTFWMATISVVIRWAQTVRFFQLVEYLPYFEKLPAILRIKYSSLPQFSGQSFKNRWHQKHGLITFSNKGDKDTKHKVVGVFTGCVLDVAEKTLMEKTVELIELAGYRIFMPPSQTCCGAIAAHSGDVRTAQKCAGINVEAFRKAACDFIVVNSAGCLRQLEHISNFVAENASTQEIKSADAFQQKLIDIVELLGEHSPILETQKWKQTLVRVLYDSPCHLIHGQGARANEKTITFLQKLPGVHVELADDHDDCCGAAGIYNLIQPDISRLILDRKESAIRSAMTNNPKVSFLLTGNPGCIFQLRGRMEEKKWPIKVLHPVEFIADRLIGKTEKNYEQERNHF
jgi:glycolate oxidase iron-sulfur subunit